MWRRARYAPAGVRTDLCRRLVLCLAALAAWATPGAAQRPLTVQGVRSLTFGTLLAGVNKSVLRTDAINGGQFDISGPSRASVLLTFTLPASMAGPGGATLPLSFGSNDGGWSPPQQIGTQTGFDPRVPFTAPLDQNGKVSVYLGGTAKPTASQKAGSYTGTITLTVVVLP
jgi:uncharacterized protein DUF4402